MQTGLFLRQTMTHSKKRQKANIIKQKKAVIPNIAQAMEESPSYAGDLSVGSADVRDDSLS